MAECTLQSSYMPNMTSMTHFVLVHLSVHLATGILYFLRILLHILLYPSELPDPPSSCYICMPYKPVTLSHWLNVILNLRIKYVYHDSKSKPERLNGPSDFVLKDTYLN